MGKNLKGKECGEGIVQRKDGRYTARFSSRSGVRRQQYFKTLQEARNWLEDARYEDKHGVPHKFEPEPESEKKDITVDEWFEYWMSNLVCDLAPNTRRNYKERYKYNIQGVIGSMYINQVKPMHCKAVFNQMEKKYAGGTLKQAYITMGTMFRAAVNNDIILKHPMDGVKFTKPCREPSDIHFLTKEEQETFLNTAKRSHNYRQYRFILETGLRTAELIGLTFDCIDWKRHTITINKTLEFRYGVGYWRAGPPKTINSYRTIPLTDKAYDILKSCYDERNIRKESETLSQKLEYIDRRSGKKEFLNMKNLVFVNWRTGEPNKNSSYDTHLYKLCDEAGIKHFCMHALRHTYATRAIEAGVQPKVLQKLLGHASIKTTMDRYVHVTDDSLFGGVRQFEDSYTRVG